MAISLQAERLILSCSASLTGSLCLKELLDMSILACCDQGLNACTVMQQLMATSRICCTCQTAIKSSMKDVKYMHCRLSH